MGLLPLLVASAVTPGAQRLRTVERGLDGTKQAVQPAVTAPTFQASRHRSPHVRNRYAAASLDQHDSKCATVAHEAKWMAVYECAHTGVQVAVTRTNLR
jgi:hypothetical protein